jgi:hypothetical protein
VEGWRGLAAGWYHSLGWVNGDLGGPLKLLSWGQNTFGQLGTGTTVQRQVPGGVPISITAPISGADPDMVAWWRGQNDAKDTVGGNNGTAKDVNNNPNGVTYVDGKVSRAFNFNGSSGYVEVPSRFDLKFTGPFSIEGWINFHGPLTPLCGDMVIGKGTDSTVAGDWLIGVSATGNLRPHLQTSWGWEWHDCQSVLQSDTWYHIAMVYDDDEGLRQWCSGWIVPGCRRRSGDIR